MRFYKRMLWKTVLISLLMVGSLPEPSVGEASDSVGNQVKGTSPITSKIELPPVFVVASHIISIHPYSQVAPRGRSATYEIRLINPLAEQVAYNLELVGLNEFVHHIPLTAELPGNSTTTVDLVVEVPANATEGDVHPFAVTVNDGEGLSDSAGGELVIGDFPAESLFLEISPSIATAGQGTAAFYQIRTTNLGDTTQPVTLSGQFPPGVTAEFSPIEFEVLPGLSIFETSVLSLTPTVGTTPDDYPFQITVQSLSNPEIVGQASAVLKVSPFGVDVQLTPQESGPNSVFTMLVTNTGLEPDTFDLSLAGSAAVDAATEADVVALDSGATETFSITTGGMSFSLPRRLDLMGIARSRGNPAVVDSDLAQVAVPEIYGVSATINPISVKLLYPDIRVFRVDVENTGNVEGAFDAAIVDVSAPLNASLVGLTGDSTQKIDLFRLPGLAQGAFIMAATLTNWGTGTATVRIQSLENDGVEFDVVGELWTDCVFDLDLNNDGFSNAKDTLLLIEAFQEFNNQETPLGEIFRFDLNCDGTIDGKDFDVMQAIWHLHERNPWLFDGSVDEPQP